MGWGMVALMAFQAVQAIGGAKSSIDAAKDEFKAADKEASRRQAETNRMAQEDRAARVAEADRQASSALVAFEAMGGAGGYNASRALGEIGGFEGLDLARIEGNRGRSVGALQKQKNLAAKASQAKQNAAYSKLIGDFVGIGTMGMADAKNDAYRDSQLQIAGGANYGGAGASYNTTGDIFGARAYTARTGTTMNFGPR